VRGFGFPFWFFVLRYISCSWAWIFIMEGVVTIAGGLLAFVFMADYPDTAKFLSPAEKHEVVRRLEEDRGALDDGWDTRYVWDAVKDWKVHSLPTRCAKMLTLFFFF